MCLHLQDFYQFLCFSLFPCISDLLIPSFLASLWQFKPYTLSHSFVKLKRQISTSPLWGTKQKRTKQKHLYRSRLRRICHLKINSQFHTHFPCWWQNWPTRMGDQLGSYFISGSCRHGQWCWQCCKVYSAWRCLVASNSYLLYKKKTKLITRGQHTRALDRPQMITELI